jgi:hypothetical protein
VVVGAIVVVLEVVLVVVLLLVLDAVVSTTVVDVLELVDELSALLCSSLHALAVSTRTPTARPTRKRRDVMASVCQPVVTANVQVSE